MSTFQGIIKTMLTQGIHCSYSCMLNKICVINFESDTKLSCTRSMAIDVHQEANGRKNSYRAFLRDNDLLILLTVSGVTPK